MQSIKHSFWLKLLAFFCAAALPLFFALGVVIAVYDYANYEYDTYFESGQYRSSEYSKLYPLKEHLINSFFSRHSSNYWYDEEYYCKERGLDNTNFKYVVTDPSGTVIDTNLESMDYAYSAEYFITQDTTGDIVSVTTAIEANIGSKLQEAVYAVKTLTITYEDAVMYVSEAQDHDILAANWEDLTVQYGVARNLENVDSFYRDYTLFELTKGCMSEGIGIAAVCLIAFLALMAYLILTAGHKNGVVGFYIAWFDRIYLDVFLLLAGTAFTLLLMLDIQLVSVSRSGAIDTRTLPTALVIVYISCAIVLGFIIITAKRIKAKTFFTQTLLYAVISRLWRAGSGILQKALGFLLKLVGGIFGWIGEALQRAGGLIADVFRNIHITGRVMSVYAAYLLINLIFVIIMSSGRSAAVRVSALLFIFLFNLAAGLCVARLTLRFQQVKIGAANISKGSAFEIETGNLNSDLKELSETINNIGRGLESAVIQQTRSDRMKAELITNVSHDIKTPLTSIINYVDLLKKANPQGENVGEYLEVLDRQAQRLKKLTEDIIEASKASTGNISVNPERIDLRELLTQAAGEYDQRFREAELRPVLAMPEEDVVIRADSRLLWRVMDNLLSNASKYAMRGTRVYLETGMSGGTAFISVKNISSEQLNISEEELMERFIRGDASRSGEGSGLGLSIARSLTELQGGRFMIGIDGDLFKAQLEFEQE